MYFYSEGVSLITELGLQFYIKWPYIDVILKCMWFYCKSYHRD